MRKSTEYRPWMKTFSIFIIRVIIIIFIVSIMYKIIIMWLSWIFVLNFVIIIIFAFIKLTIIINRVAMILGIALCILYCAQNHALLFKLGTLAIKLRPSYFRLVPIMWMPINFWKTIDTFTSCDSHDITTWVWRCSNSVCTLLSKLSRAWWNLIYCRLNEDILKESLRLYKSSNKGDILTNLSDFHKSMCKLCAILLLNSDSN